MGCSKWTRIIAMILAVALFVQGSIPVRVFAEDSIPAQTAVYEDGVILIHSYDQLLLIGSGRTVFSGDAGQIGSGGQVLSEDGKAVMYSLDANYRIACDIPLPQGALWQLPEGFCGQILPLPDPGERILYDGQTDTIYLYNPYQLAVMAMEDASAQPLLSNDADAATVGMGTLFLRADGSFVTYGPEHSYVISSRFDSAIPEHSYASGGEETTEPTEPVSIDELQENTEIRAVEHPRSRISINAVTVTGTDPWGRDFPGQVVKTIDGVKYVLIGNHEQLKAIGTGRKVYSAVYQAYNDWGTWRVDYYKSDNSLVMLYGGDADLLASQNGNKDYDLGSMDDTAIGSKFTGGSYSKGKCGVNQTTGEIDPNLDIEKAANTSYTLDNHYIIFRDLELTRYANPGSGYNRWDIPENFTGTITPWTAVEEPRTMYTEDPDGHVTIYIYHPIQLAAMNWYDGANKAVHANDAYAEQFGTGETVTLSDGSALTYSPDHTYILTGHFSSEMPNGATTDWWGREFPGQVIQYSTDGAGNEIHRILIGNEAQLRIIGSGEEVYGPGYDTDYDSDTNYYVRRDGNFRAKMLYGGDADYQRIHNGKLDTAFRTPNGDQGTYTTGVDQKTGRIIEGLAGKVNGAYKTGVHYALDEKYTIFRDIVLTEGNWSLSDDFTGEIQPMEIPESRTLYEVDETGHVTVYIHHPLQLNRLNLANASTQPIYANDAYAEQFGTGGQVAVNGQPLTYSPEHTYVISKYFSSDIPDNAAMVGDDIWGRDFPGQVVKTIDGEKYILIGNAQQLRAIGTDAKVYGAVYQTTGTSEKLDWHKDTGEYILRYSGDADLTKEHNGYDDFEFGVVRDADKSISGSSAVQRAKAGVNQETGEIDKKLDEDTGLTYSSTANYIIFRDIDLNSEPWTPLMFSGRMIGVESPRDYTMLWDRRGPNATKITVTAKPTISNIKVEQNEAVEVTQSMGIGFFATISNQYDTVNIGIVGEQALVRNLELRDVSVKNNTNKTNQDQTLVSGLLSGLGFLLGGLLDGLTWILTFGQVTLDLHEVLSNLLNARAKDPTTLATGAFAGRIVGNVLVDNCDVTGTVQVHNINNYTGGFVGYMEGATEYDGLSKTLGGIVDVLAALLNVIPGLGLGDLITILLGNVISLSTLIPTGYVEPKITNCTVRGLTGIVGNAQEGGEAGSFTGGFVGQEIGALLVNNTISDSDFTVKAKSYGGGFAGAARDAEVEGTLGLDDLINVDAGQLPNFQTQSLLMECNILGSNVRVEGTDHLGGFVGVLANSYAINNTMTGGTLVVNGTSTDKAQPAVNVGGFAGLATLGWGASLGSDTAKQDTLLGAVSNLLMGLLGDKEKSAEQQQLLSLAGVAPSAILGFEMDYDSIEVAADGSYVGGVVGRGDGLIMGQSDNAAVGELSFWKYGDALPLTEEQVRTECRVDGLKRVATGGDYAGGVAGFIGTASAGGVLDSTLGLARFIGFQVNNITVNGVEEGYTVSGGKLVDGAWADGSSVGGGFGSVVGGTIDRVVLNKIRMAEGGNRVGGFAGLAGPGDLASDGGLQLSLLGLNILEINNLLAVGQGVEVRIADSSVTGVSDGFTVEAKGTRSDHDDVTEFTAAGFLAESHSTEIHRSHVYNLKQVTAADMGGNAGGFLGTSEVGGLAEVADDEKLLDLIKADGLINAVNYLIPDYIDCTVSYVDGGGVRADVAGGYVADLQSGTVDNSGLTEPYSVYNLDHVDGQTYAGGFGGIAKSGALADAGKGISILGDLDLVDISIDVSDLLSLVNTYVPFVVNAGIYSENGFTVQANEIRDIDARSGSAGGFIGFASGAQVSNSDVNALKHTAVTPPEDLEAVEAPSYFDGRSTYAVSGGRYSGGYFGNMDIGSAASLGGGLKVLGNAIKLTNILDALSIVVTTVEHSDVYGTPGGFSVLADGVESVKREIEIGDGVFGPRVVEEIVGMAGGFAGNISGGHVQDCNVHNFNYIIGQVAAGGYVGNLHPGDVASVLNDTSILSGLVELPTELLSVAEDFVPTIRNSFTDCVPCGGAVRAHAASDKYVQRGMAGGYVGHNEGGNIWGNNTARWKEENDEIENSLGITVEWIYNGVTRPCEAIRIRSVYGYEYAGGFTGLMESADTAETGGLKLLGGLISAGNLLGVLSVVYPTEENTAVYGPLAEMDYRTWNKWVEFIGKYGGYGAALTERGLVESQAELEEFLSKYIYGFHVVAGRSEHEQMVISDGGDAGGYVGRMITGTITNGTTNDVKLVRAMRNAGGFAGRTQAGGAAKFGTLNILGLELNLGQLLGVANVFVPAIKNSAAHGYRAGMTVETFGTDFVHGCGYSGGYAGSAYGAQIWGREDGGQSCDVTNLRRVKGTNAIGGYVGMATASSVASVNTNASDGFLQSLLNVVIGNPSDLLQVLNATVTTIRGASVSAFDETYGFVVDGAYGDGEYASYAGGFAGFLEAAALSKEFEDGETVPDSYVLQVNGLRSVDGGLYAGGFFGVADVGSVATVSGSSGEKTSVLLGLIKVGQTDVLSAFRTYIYNASVNGVPDGTWIRAHDTDVEGILDSARHMGCAGGFGGGLMNGTVKDSTVTNLSTVEGLNYVGGFIGHLGKNGVVDLDDMNILGLLNPTAGILDVFGSHVDDCVLTGIADGYVVRAEGGKESVAGGFVGYADVSRINDSTAAEQKKIVSTQTAGGFIGMTNRSYLVDVEADSPLLAVILFIVNELIDLLHVGDLENVGIIDLEIPGLESVFELNVLADGNLLYVNLLGIRIGVSLSSESGQDRLHIHIGDSEINLNYVEGKDITNEDLADAEIKLFKGNRTEVNDCTVTGIAVGYDVFGGGATDDLPAVQETGHSGGFVGLNREGRFQRNGMFLCDAVRGTAGQVGPFSGTIDLKTVYDSYTIDDLEGVAGKTNTYRVYRSNVHEITHLETYRSFSDWQGSPLEVYRDGGATAVLMDDIPVSENREGLVPEPAEMLDPCEPTITLTIQKLWDDYGDALGLRPDSITVTIYQSYEKDGVSIENEYQTVTLTAGENWRREVTGLPVALIETEAGVETMYYYTYTVREDPVEYYIQTVVNSDGHLTAITNTLKPMGELPFTGSFGDLGYIGLGVALVLLGAAKQKPRRRGKYGRER